MLTAAASRSLSPAWVSDAEQVSSVADLAREGWTAAAVRAQLDAHRWQRIGRAVIRHNGPPTRLQLCRAALIILGPRAALTSFTALEQHGLAGWDRDDIHVLVPRGARVRRTPELPLRAHYTDRWLERAARMRRGRESVSDAALIAAASFARTRPACGVLAAVVQQRLVRPAELIDRLRTSMRLRHRAALLAATTDIAQGAHALGEIDLARICRRAGLPPPIHQAVRTGPGGRRRYVDAEWTRRDGRRLVVEIDGALHLLAGRWWDDQLRQNELVLADNLVLRFPSVVVRHEPALFVNHLRRGLTC